MKRRTIFKLLRFLLAGAIINFAVAWGCGAFIDLAQAAEQFNIAHDVRTGRWISDTRRDGFGASQSVRRQFRPLTYGVSGEGYILDFDMEQAAAAVLKPGELIEREGKTLYPLSIKKVQPFGILEPWTNSYGWPARSMCCWLENQAGYPSSSVFAKRRGTVRFVSGIQFGNGNPGPDAHVLPLHPIWSGFAINSIFYSVILWIFVAGLVEMRRQIRHKRNQCVACGYSLRGRVNASEKCPECGAAVAGPSPAPPGRAGG